MILIFLAAFGPICLGVIAIIWNLTGRKLPRYGLLLFGFVPTICYLAGIGILAQEMRKTACEKGDSILAAMDRYRSDHGQPIEKLTDLVPDYFEAIPGHPYFDSDYYIRDGTAIGFYAGALVTCDKSIGGEWVCDD
ncbi:MAG: hypothetical protein WBP29_07390 [Candidatus Zixiibacteriota bacterium]